MKQGCGLWVGGASTVVTSGDRKVIVNLSSELGSLGLHSYPDFPFADVNLFAYDSSKTAINAFTVLLAKELELNSPGPTGGFFMRMAVCPGEKSDPRRGA